MWKFIELPIQIALGMALVLTAERVLAAIFATG